MATSDSTEIIRTVLLAFLGGLLVPVLVQIFLTLRTIQRVALTFERRMDETARDLSAVVAGLRRESASPDMMSVFAAAAVPAAIAAIRAFRATPAEISTPHSATGAQPGEKSP